MESSKKHFMTAGRKLTRFFLAVAMISLLVAIEADSKTKPSTRENHKVEAQKEEPFFTKIPVSHMKVIEDSILTVCCIADGFPSPEVTWSKLSADCSSGLPQWSLVVRDECLTIQHVTPKDSGEYMCQASNEYGIVRALTGINVIGLKIIDTHGLEQSSILGNLDKKYLEQLMSYLNPVLMDSVRSKFVRCYHAMTDGWAVSTFHSKCDGKGPTVIIIQVNNYIFGAYTNKAWYSSPECISPWSHASEAFLFSLFNTRGYSPVQLPQYQHQQYAMYSCSYYGPTFGGGHDLYISDNANSNSKSHSDLGLTYLHPSGCVPNDSCTRSFLAGSFYFTLTDYEVFYETTS